MHSLKNTIVAVGLLGLSFVFYQFSSKTPPEEPLMSPLEPATELVAAADSQAPSKASPRVDLQAEPTPRSSTPLQPTPLPQAKPKTTAPQLPEFKLPEFGKFSTPATASKQPPSSTQNNFNPQPIAQQQPAPPSKPQPRQPSPLELEQETTADTSPKPTTKSNPPAANDFAATGPASRDQALIEALESQRQSGESNRFVSNPHATATPQRPNNSTTLAVLSNEDQSVNSTAGATVDPRNTDPQISVTGNAEPAPMTPKARPITLPNPSEYGSIAFQDAWPVVDEMVAQNRLKDALALLSQYYDDDQLTGPQRQALTGWLDALAGKVIFSTEDLLAQPYQATGNETFTELGRRWNVPGQLVFNVNRKRVSDPQVIPAGTKLKAIPGPFDAQIDRKTETMTLFLGDMYAGRFAVRIGISGDPKPGEYKVMMKSRNGFDWKDANGKVYAPGDPDNHYGEYFMGLEGFLSIHAVDESKQTGHWGCLGLLKEDARDVFAILGPGSTVTIR